MCSDHFRPLNQFGDFFHQRRNRNFLRKRILYLGIIILNSQKEVTSRAVQKIVCLYLQRQLANHIINGNYLNCYV